MFLEEIMDYIYFLCFLFFLISYFSMWGFDTIAFALKTKNHDDDDDDGLDSKIPPKRMNTNTRPPTH